jgi:tRNA threonylcarbamoyladenosine biosynthesis protein TsaB
MLLAIDTATNHASIALHDGDDLRGEYTWEAVNRHTVTLVPHIQELFEETGITPKHLSALAVCEGPGSYTGVRIGIAVAKGLAITRHLPLVGMTTLDILVAAHPPDTRPLYALFAAGRKRVGCARYHYTDGRWSVETPVEIVAWTDFADHVQSPALVSGEISKRGHKVLAEMEGIEVPPAAQRLRRAGFLAELVWKQLRAGYQGDPARLTPIYVR